MGKGGQLCCYRSHRDFRNREAGEAVMREQFAREPQSPRLQES